MLLEEGDCSFSPESVAASSEAGSYKSPFRASSRRGTDRRWGFGASLLWGCRKWAGLLTRERHRVLD